MDYDGLEVLKITTTHYRTNSSVSKILETIVPTDKGKYSTPNRQEDSHSRRYGVGGRVLANYYIPTLQKIWIWQKSPHKQVKLFKPHRTDKRGYSQQAIWTWKRVQANKGNYSTHTEQTRGNLQLAICTRRKCLSK